MSLDSIIQEYERAEITTLWIHDRTHNEHFNIFSVVEICPSEQPLSKSLKTFDKKSGRVPLVRLSLDSNRTLYFTREFKNSPSDGLEYFRGKRVVQGQNIVSYGQLTMEPPCEIPILTSETMYPNTSLENVLPKRPVSFRVCSFLDEKQTTLLQLNEKDLSKISSLTNEFLGFDLSKFKEFIGSIILALPNPYLRNFTISGVPEHESIIAEFYERVGKTILGGKIEVSDIRLFGTGFHIQKEITQPKMLIKFPYMPNTLKIKIFDKAENLIHEKESTFIQKIQLNMQVANTIRKIENLSEQESYEVQTYTPVTSTVGKREMDLQEKLRKEEEERILAQLEKNRTFIYFPGKSKDSIKYAKEVIRELIGKTKERCIICDPYFSGEDLLNFALFQKNTNVTFQCLSSAKFLKEKKNDTLREGNYLYEKISQLKNSDPSLKIECKVLKGSNKSPVHDRFLIIDNEVYLLGSSLNEFGSRATTLLKVPNPKVIIRQIENWWEDSTFTTILDDWLKHGDYIE